jgi:hypothetical protein
MKGVENMDIKAKLPGYARGGMNLDYLYEIVLNDKDITSDMTFFMHNT